VGVAGITVCVSESSPGQEIWRGRKEDTPSEGTNTFNRDEYMRYLNEMAKTKLVRFLYGYCHLV